MASSTNGHPKQLTRLHRFLKHGILVTLISCMGLAAPAMRPRSPWNTVILYVLLLANIITFYTII